MECISLAFRRLYKVLSACSSSILMNVTHFRNVLLHSLVRTIECLIYNYSHGLHVKARINSVYGVIWHKEPYRMVLVDFSWNLTATAYWTWGKLFTLLRFLSQSAIVMLHSGIVLKLSKHLIFLSDQFHVLALQIMLFIGKDNVETWLLLDLVYLRILTVLEFNAKSRCRVQFHLDALLALDRSNGQLTWGIETEKWTRIVNVTKLSILEQLKVVSINF